MLSKHLRLSLKTRVANFEGHLKGTIVQESRWWGAFKQKLAALGLQVNETEAIPDGDSLAVPVNDATRGDLIAALAAMPEESFAWFVLACPMSAMMHGGRAQIWPDGIGGFSTESKASIEAVRKAAAAWLTKAQA